MRLVNLPTQRRVRRIHCPSGMTSQSIVFALWRRLRRKLVAMASKQSFLFFMNEVPIHRINNWGHVTKNVLIWGQTKKRSGRRWFTKKLPYMGIYSLVRVKSRSWDYLHFSKFCKIYISDQQVWYLKWKLSMSATRLKCYKIFLLPNRTFIKKYQQNF